MSNALRARLTWADYLKTPCDGKRHELFDGELVVSPVPSFAHQFAVGQVAFQLYDWEKARGNGLAILGPLAVRLSSDTVMEPDAMWIAAGRVDEIVADYIYGAPDLVVEVVSPCTAELDRTRKSSLYARYGVREYWLLDPESESVEIRKLEGDSFVMHGSGRGDAELSSSLDDALRIVPSRFFRKFPRGVDPAKAAKE